MARRSANRTNSRNRDLARTNHRPRRGRTAWLIFVGLLAGVAGGAFAWRMVAPAGESERLPRKEPVPAAQPAELLPQTDPVEISTRMRPGEWTEETLQAHVEDYKQQIRNMGAAESEIVTEVERTDEGAAVVVVSWIRATA